MVVMKFGGSSVATSAAFAKVVSIVKAERRPRVVVVSALGGVTDALLELAALAAARHDAAALEAVRALRDRHASLAGVVRDDAERRAVLEHLDAGWQDVETLVRASSLLRACPPPACDAIVARGELASSRLAAAILTDAGVPAEWVDARHVVVTDSRHQQASPIAAASAAQLVRTVRPLIDRGAVPVLGGFVGATADGVTTTLGRGGSDYSASLVGACLGASEIQNLDGCRRHAHRRPEAPRPGARGGPALVRRSLRTGALRREGPGIPRRCSPPSWPGSPCASSTRSIPPAEARS